MADASNRQKVLLVMDASLARKAGAVAALRGQSRHAFLLDCIERAVAGYVPDALTVLTSEP